MHLFDLLFDEMGFDERRLLLDAMGLREMQALICTCRTACVMLSPIQLDMLNVDHNRYTWAGRPVTLPAAWHNGICLRMGTGATKVQWKCCILEHSASTVPNQWCAFGLETIDDSGFHMLLASDRGCTYVDGRLQPRKTPQLGAGDELLFTLDLSGKGSLTVRVNRGAPHVLSGSRGLVAGRGVAKDRIKFLGARAHLWDGAHGYGRGKQNHSDAARAERRAKGPHCVVRFLPGDGSGASSA